MLLCSETGKWIPIPSPTLDGWINDGCPGQGYPPAYIPYLPPTLSRYLFQIQCIFT